MEYSQLLDTVQDHYLEFVHTRSRPLGDWEVDSHDNERDSVAFHVLAIHQQNISRATETFVAEPAGDGSPSQSISCTNF